MRYGCCFYLAIAAGIMAVIHSFILCVLQHFRFYSLDTILSSKLDDDVPPKCQWRNENKKQQCNDHSSACSDVSTYISEEGRSTPPYTDDIKGEDAHKFPQYENLNCAIEDETKICHQKQNSHDSKSSTETKSTTADVSSREFDVITQNSLEFPPRKDSIGSVDPKDFDDTNSPAFSRRNFTLPLSR